MHVKREKAAEEKAGRDKDGAVCSAIQMLHTGGWWDGAPPTLKIEALCSHVFLFELPPLPTPLESTCVLSSWTSPNIL